MRMDIIIQNRGVEHFNYGQPKNVYFVPID